MTHTTTKPEEKRWIKANALSPAFNWKGKIRWYDITGMIHEQEGDFEKVMQLQKHELDLQVEWEESMPPLPGEKESKGLQIIISAITTYSAIEFAKTKLAKCKTTCADRKENYEQYMQDVYGSTNTTLNDCELRAVRQFLAEYRTCIDYYDGFMALGQVFCLDHKDRVLYFAVAADESVKLITHYNPLGVDVFEVSINKEHFFNNLDSRYEVSKDQVALIRLLNQKQ